MKQEEKSRQSREKILQAALREFGEKGYDGASLNALLSQHGLSKGLVYHYFEDKDRLYLGCVTLCFDELTDVLSKVTTQGSAETVLQAYFQARGQFFLKHPHYARLFFDALIQPPAHLQTEVAQARSGFEEKNRELYCRVLKTVRLRSGVTETDAQDYFTLMQSALHLEFLIEGKDAPALDTAMRYEEKARRAMEFLLYGVAGRCEN